VQYEAGQFGVKAEVQADPTDVEIMNQINQLVVLLHVMADRMGKEFTGHMDSTRRVIKGCRNLASDLQEEVEVRTGSLRRI
jgi:hypothetical protein